MTDISLRKTTFRLTEDEIMTLLGALGRRVPLTGMGLHGSDINLRRAAILVDAAPKPGQDRVNLRQADVVARAVCVPE